MILPGKRTHSHILERLKRIRENYRAYHFELVGVQPPKVLLKDIGIEGLETHYQSQVKKHPSLPTIPNLQNYCFLYIHLLRNLKEGNKDAVCKKDVEYTLKTIIALDSRVKKLTELLESIITPEHPAKTPKVLTKEEEEAANKIFNSIRSFVGAMNTLSTDAFIPWTRSREDEHLVKQARLIIAQYRTLGFIKN